MIVNVGCGNDFYGDVRVDFQKTRATTHVFDLNKEWPLKSDSADEIYCKSVLEHIKNLGCFADECYRVLKKNGKIYIRTDYAGFLLAHLLKKHEPNRAIDVQYESGEFGHEQGEDHHYTLFVASHLKHLFHKFKNHEFSYVYGGSNVLKNILYKLLPKRLGACHIEMRAYKN